MCGKSNHWGKLLSQRELWALSLSLSPLRNWYSKIKKGMISLIGNICLTGNSLGSDLLRLNPRWRGGRLLVVFLSLRISTLVRFWSTCKAFSEAKTIIKTFRPEQYCQLIFGKMKDKRSRFLLLEIVSYSGKQKIYFQKGNCAFYYKHKV